MGSAFSPLFLDIKYKATRSIYFNTVTFKALTLGIATPPWLLPVSGCGHEKRSIPRPTSNALVCWLSGRLGGLSARLPNDRLPGGFQGRSARTVWPAAHQRPTPPRERNCAHRRLGSTGTKALKRASCLWVCLRVSPWDQSGLAITASARQRDPAPIDPAAVWHPVRAPVAVRGSPTVSAGW